MEYSLSRSCQNTSEFYNVPFPHLSSEPATDNVNPGMGQIVNLYETIVPMKGQPKFVIVKKSETEGEDITNQIGLGSNLDPSVQKSFQHPILTESIIFPDAKNSIDDTVTVKAESKRKTNDSTQNDSKRKKLSHKFSVV